MTRRLSPNQHEAAVLRAIFHHVGSQPDYRLWRMNTGSAVNLASGRRVQFGMPGQADLTGIRRTTCPYCGAPGPGQRVEIETKSATGTLKEHQATYGNVIRQFGGIYIVPRSLSEACELLGLPVPR